mgnify:CR=1 FL=1
MQNDPPAGHQQADLVTPSIRLKRSAWKTDTCINYEQPFTSSYLTKRVDCVRILWQLKITFYSEWYPRGRRGSPAKGVGGLKAARGFKSLSLRQQKSPICLPDKSGFFEWCVPSEREAHCVRDAVFTRDARLRRVSGTHRIAYHSVAASLITYLQNIVIYDIIIKKRGVHYVWIET